MAEERFDSEDQELELSEDFDEDEDEGLEEIEVYTLEDEDGNESEFTLIKRMTIEENDYVAFEYFNEDEENEIGDEEDSFVILKVIEEDGEEVFVTIEDDEEFDKVADIFEDVLMEEFGDDEDDE